MAFLIISSHPDTSKLSCHEIYTSIFTCLSWPQLMHLCWTSTACYVVPMLFRNTASPFRLLVFIKFQQLHSSYTTTIINVCIWYIYCTLSSGEVTWQYNLAFAITTSTHTHLAHLQYLYSLGHTFKTCTWLVFGGIREGTSAMERMSGIWQFVTMLQDSP